MLSTKLHVQSILESRQSLVLVAGDGHGGGLVAGRMYFDLMLERVVVEVVWVGEIRVRERSTAGPTSGTYEDSIRERIPAQDADQTSCLNQYKPRGVGANWGRCIRIKEWTIEIVSLKLLAIVAPQSNRRRMRRAGEVGEELAEGESSRDQREERMESLLLNTGPNCEYGAARGCFLYSIWK